MRARSGLGRLLGGEESRCRPVRLDILRIVSFYPHNPRKTATKAPLHMFGFLMLERLGLTIRMPDLADEFHGRWRERIIFRELELGGEYTALEWRSLRPLDQRFPV